MKLRDYQADIAAQILASCEDVLVQLDTGAGKTPIISEIARCSSALIVAHRDVLISQTSTHLARAGIRHAVIATRHTRDSCRRAHSESGVHGDWVDDSSCVSVASLFSFASRLRRGLLVTQHWRKIIIDEAHHVAPGNTWSSVREACPEALLIGFTATPCRLDGAPLGRMNGGQFDRLIQADALRENSVSTLIARGYLSDYRAFSIASKFDREALRIGAAGDYTFDSLQVAMDGSAVHGDAVREYRRIAEGTRALAVCAAIGNAEELAETARDAGIPATVIHSKLGAVENARRLQAFRDGRVLLLANVDMLGEGFDLPDIETLIMLRPTASFARYRQWVGRALRPAPDKTAAILIDHVGNIVTHGLPDDDVRWSIERSPPQQRTNLIDCEACSTVFRAWLTHCPSCGAEHDLRRRLSSGGGYVNQRVIDADLCEIRRQRGRVDRMWETEVVRPHTGFGDDLIGRTCQRLIDWIADTLAISDLPRSEINEYLRASASREALIDRFTLADLKSDRRQKIHKEFQRWQSQFAAQTRRNALAARTSS